MRPSLLILLALSARPFFGQPYTIHTFAGGGLPVNLPGTSASLGAVSGLTTDLAGNLFIALHGGITRFGYNGSDYTEQFGYDTVLRLDAGTGALTLVAGNGTAGNGTAGKSGDGGPATSAQLNGPTSLAVDSSGDLYFVDSLNFKIRKVSKGVITTVAGNGTQGVSAGPATGAIAPDRIAVDAGGTLYFSDIANHVFKVSNGTMMVVAGNGAPGFSGDGGPVTKAQVNHPSGIAVDAAGDLYIADTGNDRVRKVSNLTITTIAGNGTQGNSGDGGPASAAQLNGPGSVWLDAQGNLYIAETSNVPGESWHVRVVSNGTITTLPGSGVHDHSIAYVGGDTGSRGTIDAAGNLYSLSPGTVWSNICTSNPCAHVGSPDYYNWAIQRLSGGSVTTVAGGGSALGDGGPARSAQLYCPAGVSRDLAGDLFIGDACSRLIREVSNGIITTVAGGGALPAENSPATSVELIGVGGVAAATGGSFYIGDESRARKVSNGFITTVAGGGNAVPGDGSPAVKAQLGTPQGLALDLAGNLYIADSAYGNVRSVSPGGTISTIPTTDSVNDAQLSTPAAVAVDANGNIYIADAGNNRIEKVSNGVPTIIAGTGTPGYSGDDGPAINAQLASPLGIAVDYIGNIYVADTGNNRIRKISQGTITTIAGTGTPGYGGDDGPAASAELNLPGALTVDTYGNVYVADRENHRIRILVPSGSLCPARGRCPVFWPGQPLPRRPHGSGAAAP